MTDAVLEMKNVGVSFGTLQVVRELSAQIHAGEVLAVIGASGSGKSLLAHGIMGILPPEAGLSGDIFFRGQRLDASLCRRLRGRQMALIPQNVSYLDPTMKIGAQITNGQRRKTAQMQALLARYGLPEAVAEAYPFMLSGGMLRRVLIAAAVVENPDLIIADEPTVGLHLAAAREVLHHLRKLADEGAALLVITHDLSLALEVADRLLVMYGGMALEEAAAGDFADETLLRHPYSRALWRAMPQNGFAPWTKQMPAADEAWMGCLFAAHCDRFTKACRGAIPWQKVRGGFVRCVQEGE